MYNKMAKKRKEKIRDARRPQIFEKKASDEMTEQDCSSKNRMAGKKEEEEARGHGEKRDMEDVAIKISRYALMRWWRKGLDSNFSCLTTYPSSPITESKHAAPTQQANRDRQRKNVHLAATKEKNI